MVPEPFDIGCLLFQPCRNLQRGSKFVVGKWWRKRQPIRRKMQFKQVRHFQLFYLVEKELRLICEIHELFSRMTKFKSRLLDFSQYPWSCRRDWWGGGWLPSSCPPPPFSSNHPRVWKHFRTRESAAVAIRGLNRLVRRAASSSLNTHLTSAGN